MTDHTDINSDYFKPLAYGYKCFTGHILPNIHVDSINALTERYKKRVEAGFPLSEQHLNDRHRLFVSYATARHSSRGTLADAQDAREFYAANS